MDKSNKGHTGTTLNPSKSLDTMVKTKIYALLELKRLGKRPKRMSHGSRRSSLAHIANGDNKQQWYWLIDYRNDNRRILKRPLTRYQAWIRNQTLKGTGKAWAMVGES